MARANTTDFYQSFQFHVVEPSGLLNPAAGFQGVAIPELSIDPTEYREGLFKMTQKYPGIPTVTEVTLRRGVAKIESDFYNWVRAAIDGERYRTDLEIWQFHRTDQIGPTGSPSRIIRLLEAFATRVRPGADLDGTAGEISIEEVTLTIEDFELEIRA